LKPLTYVLVDFENLQPAASEVALVRGDEYRLLIFRGPQQNKYDATMAEAWQPLGRQVSFVQSSRAGKNALDFYIAFCLGQLCEECAAAQRQARFVVVSQDGGFRPLFEYMAFSLGASVGIAPSIPRALALAGGLKPAVPAPNGAPLAAVAVGTVPSAPKQPPPVAKAAAKKVAKEAAKTAAKESTSAAKPPTAAGAVAKVVAYLRAHPDNRPTTQKSLENHIPSMVGGKMTKEAIGELVATLVSGGIATITGKQIEYKLPKAKKQGAPAAGKADSADAGKGAR
jgi:hypothetical protein